jgi:hypothetical protein
VFGEARKRFVFELRGFALVEERLSFYIRPADGLQLPAIMQWLKQTFAVRFNLSEDKTGHVWGDRYWSRVLEGEPPEGAMEVDWSAVDVGAETGEISVGACPQDGVSPLVEEPPAETGFSPQNPARSLPPPSTAPSPAHTAFALPPGTAPSPVRPALALRPAPQQALTLRLHATNHLNPRNPQTKNTRNHGLRG